MNKKNDTTTMYKNNSRDSSKFKGFSPLKLQFGLIGKCHSIYHYSCNLPLPARRRKRTVEHKLKLLKRVLKHIIRQLTDWKDFVFADPHKKKAYAHCIHLQIAHAYPQTKICKRVQFLPSLNRSVIIHILLKDLILTSNFIVVVSRIIVDIFEKNKFSHIIKKYMEALRIILRFELISI